MHALGELHDKGEGGVPHDPPQALELWLTSGAQGLPASQFTAGLYYFDARVIEGEEVGELGRVREKV